MASPKQSIFREHALKRYLQRQNQGIILRLVSPPIFIFLWILLLLLLAAGLLAWRTHVPVFAGGQGLLVKPQLVGLQGKSAVAVLFVQPGQQTGLRVGQPVTLSVGSASTQLDGQITHITTRTISPDEARRRFNLQGALAQLVTAPSLTVIITLMSEVNPDLYTGSLCSVSVQIGTRSVLSLVPGLDWLQ